MQTSRYAHRFPGTNIMYFRLKMEGFDTMEKMYEHRKMRAREAKTWLINQAGTGGWAITEHYDIRVTDKHLAMAFLLRWG